MSEHVDFSTLTDILAAGARDDRDWYEAEARGLVRTGDRLAADIGCGGAGMARALVLAGVPRVVAADADSAVLHAAAADGPPGIDFVVASLPDGLPALADTFGRPGADIVWAAASVHHVGDQQAAVDGLAGLLAPGGRLALAEGGLPARHLPLDVGVGDPGLEDRLQAAHMRWFGTMRAALPGSVPMPYGWPEAVRRAGLVDVTTRSTLLERPVPLGDDDREHLLAGLTWRVQRITEAGTLEPADVAAWSRLLDPDDPVWLGARTDLYSLRVYSVHIGVRA